MEPSCRSRRSPGRSRLLSGPLAGIGAEIEKLNGHFLGTVVAEDRRSWHLDDGKAVRKATQGQKWRWIAGLSDATTTDDAASTSRSPSTRQSSVRARIANEVAELEVHECILPDWAIVSVTKWLPLGPAMRLQMACRTWAALLNGHIPILLLPPQTDALLAFCLLEVLLCFDDQRLPLPMSAVYGEMRVAARRSSMEPRARKYLEPFLGSERPHHICWEVDIKQSHFKTLDRLAKHFDGKRLIETCRKRWRQQIHHSPNYRTCTELLLTRVNRSHPLFLEHEQWTVAAEQSADSLSA